MHLGHGLHGVRVSRVQEKERMKSLTAREGRLFQLRGSVHEKVGVLEDRHPVVGRSRHGGERHVRRGAQAVVHLRGWHGRGRPERSTHALPYCPTG
eukprot:5228366-Pyramimonas_sp.AAC.1